MGVDKSKFAAATPDTSGVTAAHIRDIAMACRANNTFLFVRPSTVPTMRLIKAGFATKSMDVHDKSSDWGLTSGLVPCDQSFSKALKGQPNPNIHPHGHGEAQPVHLTYTPTAFTELLNSKHFEFTEEVKAGPCTTKNTTANFRHFHSSKNPNVCFLMSTQAVGKDPVGSVYWQARTGDGKLTPIWVWGYKNVPVTGDYDMWMVAPHISKLGGMNTINSNKDAHGRSAASGFTTGFIQQLNVACDRVAKPVFNHGAEAQNVSFTQAMDKRLAVFTPGIMHPFMIGRILLPGLLHDLLLHGYVVVRNPKWLSGVTLGIEDMADAASQFPDDPAVKAGAGAMNDLKKSAALAMANRFRQNKYNIPALKNASWEERFNTLRYFRAIGRMPDASGSPETLMLPPEAFPVSGPGSDSDARDSAIKLGKEMEDGFGRTGFMMEDGHLSPVDQSRPTPGKLGSDRFNKAWGTQGGFKMPPKPTVNH